MLVVDGLGGLYHPDYGKTELEYANIPEIDNLADENDKDSNEIEIEEASNESEKRMRAKNSFGDQKYKLKSTDKGLNKNLMLHSYKIKFMINEKKYI